MLIHVAFALLALLAFTTFVVDYGVLWVARRQAQNSADAGALAGAIAAAYDDPNDLTDTGPAKQNAYAATQNNIVFGQPPSVVISSDITFPTCPDGYGRCIRVDTYRTVARGNPLPMFFGQLIGLDNQDVRAMAMAQIVPGNTSECLKPWAVPDKWDERQTPEWDATDTFDRYDRDFNVIPNPDVYIPPD
ncbi:MAG TPA: pilus assembly protein TadG-related protein, partial [Vicinamibacterales bacterium]|nr:pilus assembly protein TadG-related protein [Vicinamibacterales bacterium]